MLGGPLVPAFLGQNSFGIAKLNRGNVVIPRFAQLRNGIDRWPTKKEFFEWLEVSARRLGQIGRKIPFRCSHNRRGNILHPAEFGSLCLGRHVAKKIDRLLRMWAGAPRTK